MNCCTKRNVPFKGYPFAAVAGSSRIGVGTKAKQIVRESANVEV